MTRFVSKAAIIAVLLFTGTAWTTTATVVLMLALQEAAE